MNELEELFSDFGDTLIQEIRDAMAAGEINATGKSSDSLRYEASEDHFTLYGDKSFVWMEQGRAPGGQPPLDNIVDWVEAKGIQPDEGTQESLAWAIVKKIEREGTKAFQSGKRRDVYSSVITQARIDAFITIVSARIGRSVKTDLLYQLQ